MTFEIETKRKVELVEITSLVAASLSSIRSGVCTVYVPHTTCGIVINESEQGLVQDIASFFASVVPEKNYLHNAVDSNASAHLRAILAGPSKTIPIQNGRLALGAWQHIFLVEFDGPKKRTVIVEAASSGL